MANSDFWGGVKNVAGGLANVGTLGLFDTFKNLATGQQDAHQALRRLIDNKEIYPQTISRLFAQKAQGVPYNEILAGLKPEDYIKRPEQAKPDMKALQSRQLYTGIMDRLSGQTRDINQAIQQSPTSMFGMGQAPPIQQETLFQQIPKQEQAVLTDIFAKGLGDVSKAPELLPSLYGVPDDQVVADQRAAEAWERFAPSLMNIFPQEGAGQAVGSIGQYGADIGEPLTAQNLIDLVVKLQAEKRAMAEVEASQKNKQADRDVRKYIADLRQGAASEKTSFDAFKSMSDLLEEVAKNIAGSGEPVTAQHRAQAIEQLGVIHPDTFGSYFAALEESEPGIVNKIIKKVSFGRLGDGDRPPTLKRPSLGESKVDNLADKYGF